MSDAQKIAQLLLAPDDKYADWRRSDNIDDRRGESVFSKLPSMLGLPSYSWADLAAMAKNPMTPMDQIFPERHGMVVPDPNHLAIQAGALDIGKLRR
jgi:hypothetical protein